VVRQSYTAVVERNRVFSGEFATEPYECGWASEAIFYVRKLEFTRELLGSVLRVQISPDGIRWCDEGSIVTLTDADVDFVKVHHFGNWLRLAGDWIAGASATVIVALALKE
jgi:hypothetical protein